MKIFSLITIVCLCLAPLAAQNDVDKQLDIAESFTVSAAAVEVVVTDAKGQRVANLPKDAFRLYVDKQEQPLSYFMEIRGQSDPSAATAAHVIDEGDMPRNYLVFIDDWFTQRAYRARLFKRLIEDLDSMRPNDRMAIVRYRGKGLELLSVWSSNKIQLRDIIESAAGLTPGEQLRQAQVDHNHVDSVAPIFRPGDPNHHDFTGRQDERSLQRKGEVLTTQIEDSAKVVEVAMRSFSGVDGRKSLLLVSSGWPYDIGNLFNLSNRIAPNQGDRYHLLRPVSDAANLLGYTIYPLLLGQVGDTLENSDLNRGSDFAISYDGMRFLANETGGAVVNKAQFKELPFSQVAADQQGYYTLGFITSELTRGERHQIEVRIPGTDYKVRHRQDFRATTAQEQADLSARAVLLTGFSADDLDVTLGTPQRHKFGQLIVPVTVQIPLDWTGMEAVGDQVAVKLILRVAAEDKNGHQSEMVRAPIEIKGPRPPQGAVTSYDAQILVAKRKQRLVFTLQDQIGGATKSTTVDFVP